MKGAKEEKLTVQEYALRTGVSESYVRRCIRKGRLGRFTDIVRVGRHGKSYEIYCISKIN